ncbi:unnamed protein product [Mytilus edulis]|uniref:Uncharacterized protein n=1 Tax=Mytilus edulis TaxID=6550 RepID=A0A8S3Q4A6_MYTED|nr:unnamed protein product [Mytilus edulis]
MKYDCTGVACCLAIDYLPGVRNTEIRLEIDSCGVNKTVEMTWTVERKTGTEIFNGLAIGSTKQIDISSAFQLNVTFDDEHPKWFFVSVALRACEVSPFPGVCQTFQVLQSSGIAKNCHGSHFTARRRKRDTKDVSFRSRNLMSFDESDIDKDGTIEQLIFEEVVRRQIRIAKRSTSEPDVTNFKEGIKILLDRNASNEEIVTYVTQVRNYELQKRLNNLQSVDLGDGDRTTGQRAALKALGSNEAIFLMINSSGLPESQQSYVIGQGLSVNGTKLLAVKLANLTITDLRNIMDMRRLELMSVKGLLTDIRDLTKALYFDFYDELSSEGDNIFTSLDLTLTGTLDFPRQDVQAMEYTKDFLLGGLVPMKFDFNVGGYYGMKFSVDASLAGMKATSGIQPFGGAVVSGELQVGYAMSAVLKLEGQILELKFPTVAEITYNKFPLDVGVEMTLKLTPTRLSLNGAVTLNVTFANSSTNDATPASPSYTPRRNGLPRVPRRIPSPLSPNRTYNVVGVAPEQSLMQPTTYLTSRIASPSLPEASQTHLNRTTSVHALSPLPLDASFDFTHHQDENDDQEIVENSIQDPELTILPDRPSTFSIKEKGIQRSNLKLVSSDGYEYTKKVYIFLQVQN